MIEFDTDTEKCGQHSGTHRGKQQGKNTKKNYTSICIAQTEHPRPIRVEYILIRLK